MKTAKHNWKKVQGWSLLLVLVLFAFGCEEEWEGPKDRFTVWIWAGLPGENGRIDDIEGNIQFPVAEADVWIYSTEQDYVLNQNAIYHGKTNAEGLHEYTHPDSSSIWYRVVKGKLTNDRFSNPNRDCYHILNREKNYIDFPENDIPCCNTSVQTNLATPPSQLQITVYHNGKPMEGAEVQLYFSEEAYNSDLKGQVDYEELRSSYGIREAGQDLFGYTFRNCLEETFKKTSDAEGVVYFNDLESKQYFFRITKGELSNEGGTIQLDEPLSEDPNITRSITVGIN